MKRFLGSLFALAAGGLLLISNPLDAKAEEAKQLKVKYSTSKGNTFSNGTDDSYDSYGTLSSGEILTITAEEDIRGVYIKWNRTPGNWTLKAGDTSITGGANEFLHEYVAVEAGAKEITIEADHSMTVCDIDVYGAGDLPENVQVWQPSCEKADILVFPTHADDEILFLGATLVNYAGRDNLAVQVAYMCEFVSTGQDKREHEKLDGLWMCKIKNYPVCGNFYDVYCADLDAAMEKYDYDKLVTYTTETVRRFQPLVVVSQDFNGEYGHGGHRIFAKAIADAVDNSSKADFEPASASQYGTYDVPKAYFHLYDLDGEKEVELVTNEGLKNFDTPYYKGLIKKLLEEDEHVPTCYDICRLAYKQHVSQQWCAFLVAEDYDMSASSKFGRHYSIRKFGLYRSTVGADVAKNDLMENLKSYEQIAAEEEAARLEEEKRKEEEQKQQELEQQNGSESATGASSRSTGDIIKLVAMIVLAVVLVLILVIVLRYRYVQSRRKKRLKNKKK